MDGEGDCRPQNWTSDIHPPTPMSETYIVILILLFWACLMFTLVVMRYLRAKYFHEKEEVEELYRDGGRRTSGLIITYFVANMAGFFSFFDTSKAVYKNGLSGAFFHSVVSALAITLLAPLSIQLKTKAPGARTFLQVIRARYGTPVHIIYCACAILINLSTIFEVCAKTLTALIKTSEDMNTELVLGILIFTIGITLAYGGISGVFTCCYILNAIIMLAVLIIGDAVFFNGALYPLGDCSRIITLTKCQVAKNGQPVLSIFSTSSIFYGVEEFGVFMVYDVLNQVFWQGLISSETETGGFNILASGVFFFPIMVVFGSACGLGYMALNMAYGQVMLSEAKEELGLMVYSVNYLLFGSNGTILLDVIIVCCLVINICSEISAIGSIFAVDIYMAYIRPFKRIEQVNNCVLCGFQRSQTSGNQRRCHCKSMTSCHHCQQDDKDYHFARRSLKFWARCPVHAEYRRYVEHTQLVRTYTIYIILASFLLLAMLVNFESIALLKIRKYVALFCGTTIGGLYFAFYWARVTSTAVLAGIASTTACAIGAVIANLILQQNIIEEAVTAAIVMSIVVTAIITMVTTKPLSEEEEIEVWEKTRSIDNPLHLWSEIYSKDLGLRNARILTEARPRLDDVQRAFSFSSKILHYSVLLLVTLYVVIIPLVAWAFQKISINHFDVYIFILLTWLSTSLAFLLIMPPVCGIEEAYAIIKERKEKHYNRDYTRRLYSNAMSSYIQSVKEKTSHFWPFTKKNN